MPIRSQRTFHQIVCEKSKNSIIFILPFTMGDVLYAMSLMWKLGNLSLGHFKIIIVTYNKHEKLLKSFGGYDELHLYSMRGSPYRKIESLVANYELAKEAIKENVFICPKAFVNRGAQNPDLIFQMKSILNLSLDTPLQFHNIEACSVRSIPDFDQNHKRIIVVNMHSNTAHVSQEGKTWFENVCSFLSQKGYILYSNILKGQNPIKGTKGLNCELGELLAIAKKIPLIISLRSGILDFIVKTNVNMFIAYSYPLDLSVLSIESWGCAGKYKEVSIYELIKDKENKIFKDFAFSILEDLKEEM